MRDVLISAGLPCEAHGPNLTVTFLGQAGETALFGNAALELELTLEGDRILLSADFGVDARFPETLLDLLWLANDLNKGARVGRAFVEPELNGDELGGATLWIEAGLSLPGEAHLAALPDFVQTFGADVQAALTALTGGEE